MLNTFPRALLVASIALLVAAALLLGREGQSPVATAGPYVQPKVHAELARMKNVDVLVTLREPVGVAGLPPTSAAAQSIIHDHKNGVLTGLAPSEFHEFREYSSLPVLAGTISESGLVKLSAHPDVANVSIDGVGSIATGQTLPIIHVPEVHSAGFTGDGIVVAVLDTGADIDHPDLEDDIAFEACFLSGNDCEENPAHPGDDDHGHGTNVTGIITSDGTVAPLGVAPDAEIGVYKVLNGSGFGRFSDWVAALDDIITNHPEVDAINMSLQSRDSCPSAALTTAVSTLRDMGVPTFIASGNHGFKEQMAVPSCIQEAISVGATYDGNIGSVSGWKSDCEDSTTALDQVSCWSDSDPTLDLLAPGARATSTGAGGGTITYMGTSQAAPHGAGVAALLMEAFPNITVNQLELRMKSTGKLLTDDLGDSDPNTNRTTPRIDARVALLDPLADTDGDGCRNNEEFGTDPRFGGQRNPLDPWDFHDVNGDGVITLFDDILAVIGGFGTVGNDPTLDRSPAPAAAQPWRQGPPDGMIDVANDILGIASQFGHHCQGS